MVTHPGLIEKLSTLLYKSHSYLLKAKPYEEKAFSLPHLNHSRSPYPERRQNEMKYGKLLTTSYTKKCKENTLTVAGIFTVS